MNRLNPLKNTAWEKPAISVIGAKCAAELSSSITLKRIVADAFGRRSKKTFRKLLTLLVGFNVAFWCTDNFSAYDMLPNEKHITGKLYTQRIERENLNLRNRLKRLNRKTLGYSTSVEMHEKIIGTFIEREYYLQ